MRIKTEISGGKSRSRRVRRADAKRLARKARRAADRRSVEGGR